MFIEYSFPDSDGGRHSLRICGYPTSGMPRALRNFTRTCAFRAAVCIALLAGTVASSLAADANTEFKPLLQRAFELHRRGEFSAALPLLQRAHAMQPDDYFVNLLLGIDSLRVADVKASIPYLKKASRLRPKEEYPLSYLGEAYARRGQFAEAAAAYIKASEIAPRSAEASIAFVDFALARFGDISTFLRSSTKGLAAEYRLRALASGEEDRGRVDLLKRAADLDPAAPGIWSDLAQAALQFSDSKSAAEDCHQALALDRNDLAAWMVDAELAAQAGDWKRTNERVNRIAQRSPHILASEAGNWPRQLLPPEGTVSGAAAKFFTCVREAKSGCPVGPENHSNARAIELFQEQRWEQLVELPAPPAGQSEDWLRRGIAFAKLEDCEHAIPALEFATKGTSSNLYASFQLSRCYSEQAGRTAQQVRALAENSSPLHIMRGDIFLRLQSKPDLAIHEYQKALAINANDPSVLERLAEAQFGAGKEDTARATAEAALKIDPQRMGAKRTLAKIAMRDRDYSAALPYLQELAARNPNDVSGRVELAKAFAQTGALEQALQNLAPALEQGYPDEKGTLHYLLGTVLKKMGRDSDAERAFAKASQISDAFQQKSYRDQDADAQP